MCSGISDLGAALRKGYKQGFDKRLFVSYNKAGEMLNFHAHTNHVAVCINAGFDPVDLGRGPRTWLPHKLPSGSPGCLSCRNSTLWGGPEGVYYLMDPRAKSFMS